MKLRPADPSEFPTLESMVIESFAPITWFQRVDRRFGPLNGLDWRARWRLRLAGVFRGQTILVGEADGAIVAFASISIDARTATGFIDLIAVDQRVQRRGYGRKMLRATLDYMQRHGAAWCGLDCLTDNHGANALYESEGFSEVARHIRWFKKL
ncbi:MAG: GNAT family N-acetyltransferase [Bryobacteraceae bacterium]